MHYSQVTLPRTKERLVGCYLYLSMQLRSLWVEYVTYTEERHGPTDPEIFKVIFSEMDFFEGLRQRVASRLPPELVQSLKNVDDYSGW